MKKRTFHKTYFASKRFYGRVKCKFGKSVEALSTKGQEVLTQSPKKKNFLEKTSFHQNVRMDTWKTVLTNWMKSFQSMSKDE